MERRESGRDDDAVIAHAAVAALRDGHGPLRASFSVPIVIARHPVSHRAAAYGAVAALAALLGGCIQTVVPRVAPARVSAVDPPLAADAVVLITPSFAGQTGSSDDDGPPFPTGNSYQLGAAAESLVVAWAAASFRTVAVERVAEGEALRRFVGASRQATGAVLLMPRFAGRLGEPYEGRRFVARLRLDARSTRTGGVWSWEGTGRGAGQFFGPAGLASGRALEAAVRALADSVAAHRDSL